MVEKAIALLLMLVSLTIVTAAPYLALLPWTRSFQLISRVIISRALCRHDRRVVNPMGLDSEGRLRFRIVCNKCGKTSSRVAEPQTLRMLVEGRWRYVYDVEFPHLKEEVYYEIVDDILSKKVVAIARERVGDARAMLRRLGLRLRIRQREFTDRILGLKLRGDTLYVLCNYHVMGELKSSDGLIEVRVAEFYRDAYGFDMVSLIQLVGKLKPYEYVLDSLIVGRNKLGVWAIKTPPELWGKSLEEQLAYILDRKAYIQA
jgi:hypothetical protein